MIAHLALGTLLIVINVAIQAELFGAFNRRLEQIILFLRRRLRRFANTATLIAGVLFVLLVISIQIWIWAIAFLLAGAIEGLEPALYFTTVSFTTLGFGDITLDPNWRLLSGITAANGFLSFGWTTAYMVELVRRTA
jgi:hypothetical protein